MNNITEADESATSKAQALSNLQIQIISGETMGVTALYEHAAKNAGASREEIEQASKIAQKIAKSKPTWKRIPDEEAFD